MRLNAACSGRVFHDCIEQNGDLVLRFRDGRNAVAAWGVDGPELKSLEYGLAPDTVDMHPQFGYVSGKTVRAVLTDGERLRVEFTDDHSFRIGMPKSAPIPEGVDVTLTLQGVSFSGMASQI